MLPVMTELDFTQLETPCLLLDETKLLNNVSNMRNKARSTNVALRPHAKTAKSAGIMQLFGDEGVKTSLTVSTLKEAEYFAAHGFTDLLYAVCITPDKFPRVARIQRQNTKLTVVLDSIATCQALVEFAQQQSIVFSVAIEIDCDGERAGLVPEDPKVVEIAKTLDDCEFISFWGVMTHGGGSYHCQSIEQIKLHSQLERTKVLQAADSIRENQVQCVNVSLGSTPTVIAAEHFDGITEIRPGVFVFFDLFQAQLGTCDFNDIALSVLTTVTSHKPESNRIFVDAGALALSKDRSTQHQTQHHGQGQDQGYGKVLMEEGDEFSPGLTITGVNQEHGVIDLPEDYKVSDFPIGCRLRILPNHSCMTAAAYDGYHLLSANSELQWVSRCNGW